MSAWKISVFILLLLLSVRLFQGKKKLWIGGFYRYKRSVVAAVDMARQEVNKRNDILPNHDLHVEWKDTRCQLGGGNKALFEQVMNPPVKVMLIGGICSVSTQPIAELSPMFNLLQVGYGATAIPLSSRSTYPNFLRVNPGEDLMNQARLEIIRRFKWKRIAILYRDSNFFTVTATQLRKVLEAEGVTVITEHFRTNPDIQVRLLKKQDIRVTVGLFYSSQASKVFCQAFKENMFGPKYVWILDWYATKFTNKSVTCTNTEMNKAAGDFLWITEHVNLADTKTNMVNGKNANETWHDFLIEAAKPEHIENDVKPTMENVAAYGYDSLWAAALALNTTMGLLKNLNKTLDDFKYGDNDTFLVLKAALRDTSFTGLTGNVSFTNLGNREMGVLIGQSQDRRETPIGMFFNATGGFHTTESEFIWSLGFPPKDSIIPLTHEIKLSRTIFIVSVLLFSLGLIMAILFLAYNIWKSNHVFVKMSSPRLNNLILIGSMMIYSSGIIMGITDVPDQTAILLCQISQWTISVGFTLAYGAMFSKTWRVHVIFVNRLERKVVTDWQLFCVVATMLSIDVIISVTWSIVDRPSIQVKNIGEKIADQDGIYSTQNYIKHCHSQYEHVWSGLIYSYKGILLILGTFMAWETRNITVRALNDSKYIGLSVYVVFLSCLFGLPLLRVLEDDADTSYIVITVLIMLCTSTTLLLVFVPKIIEVRRDPEGKFRPRFYVTTNKRSQTRGLTTVGVDGSMQTRL